MASETPDDIDIKTKDTLDVAKDVPTPTDNTKLAADGSPIVSDTSGSTLNSDAINNFTNTAGSQDPNNTALGDSMWLGSDDESLAAEALRDLELSENNDDVEPRNANFNGIVNNLSGLNDKNSEPKDSTPQPVPNAPAAGASEAVSEAKGANQSILERLNAMNDQPKGKVDIQSIIAGTQANNAKLTQLEAQLPEKTAAENGPPPVSEDDLKNMPPDLDDDGEEMEYDDQGMLIVGGAGRKPAKRVSSTPRANSNTSNNPAANKASNTAATANNPAANKASNTTATANNPAASKASNTTATANNPAANKASTKPGSNTAAAGKPKSSNASASTAGAATSTAATPVMTPAVSTGTPTPGKVNTNNPPPPQNSGQSGNQPQNAGGQQGGGHPSSMGGGGGGGGGGASLGQNIVGLVSNTVGLAKNTVGVASTAVAAIPAFASAIKNQATTTATAVQNLKGNTEASTNTSTGTPTKRVPIPRSINPTVNNGGMGANYNVNGLRPPLQPNASLANATLTSTGHVNHIRPANNNNNIPANGISNTQSNSPGIKTSASSNAQGNKPNGAPTPQQTLNNIAKQSKQKKQGLFANLPQDNPMHNLPSTTKQVLEDAHSARNNINENLSSIENDNPIGTLLDKKKKGLNDGFRDYTDSSEAANDLLKKPKDAKEREATLEATKHLDGLNKDVSEKSDTAKGKNLLDKDNEKNLDGKMKSIAEGTKKLMESIKAAIDNVVKLFSRKPKPQ